MAEDVQDHSAQGFQPTDDDDDKAFAAAKAAMRDMIRNGGRVMLPETLTRGESRLVRLIEDGTAVEDYVPQGPDDKPDGQMVTWTAQSKPRLRDEGKPVGEIVERGESEDGRPWVRIHLPEQITETGGGYRVRHDLGGEVTVAAYAGEHQIEYMLASPIDDNIEHVEVFATTTDLRVILDVVAEDDEVPEVVVL